MEFWQNIEKKHVKIKSFIHNRVKL